MFSKNTYTVQTIHPSGWLRNQSFMGIYVWYVPNHFTQLTQQVFSTHVEKMVWLDWKSEKVQKGRKRGENVWENVFNCQMCKREKSSCGCKTKTSWKAVNHSVELREFADIADSSPQIQVTTSPMTLHITIWLIVNIKDLTSCFTTNKLSTANFLLQIWQILNISHVDGSRWITFDAAEGCVHTAWKTQHIVYFSISVFYESFKNSGF